MTVSTGTLRHCPQGLPRRERGYIRKCGNSYQVLVYAGTDPLTGKPNYLTESSTDEAKARQALTRLLAEVDGQRNARTKATLGVALDAWPRVHEVEANTHRADAGYIRLQSSPLLATSS